MAPSIEELPAASPGGSERWNQDRRSPGRRDRRMVLWLFRCKTLAKHQGFLARLKDHPRFWRRWSAAVARYRHRVRASNWGGRSSRRCRQGKTAIC